jgi:hypothetical protein
MKAQVSPEVFARAMVVAENLKRQLEARLINKTPPAGSCGTSRAGPSRVVAISIPTDYPEGIGRWLSWRCEMEDNTGKRWRHSLSNYIPFPELYYMFRNAFAGIDVRVKHAFARSYHCQPAPFVHSGRTVEISSNPVFVRPICDLSQSVWVNAELRIDSRLEHHDSDEALIACNIDAFEFGQPRGRGNGEYYILDANGQAFYVFVPWNGPSHDQDIYLPIARVVAANKEAGTAIIELDQSVEVFLPQ